MTEQIKQTEIIVLLDKSGSMGTISQATVEGFNSFLNEQKSTPGEAFITLIQFNHSYEITYKGMPIQEAPELINNETYIQSGTTALYESIGKTINELQTDRDVIFVIITDGMDNVKSEYTSEAINKMITTLQDEDGYKFIFLAANQDAIKTGSNIGIRGSNSMSYAATSDGIGKSFKSVSMNLTNYRNSRTEATYDTYLADNMDKNISYTDYLNKVSVDKLGFNDKQRKDSK